MKVVRSKILKGTEAENPLKSAGIAAFFANLFPTKKTQKKAKIT